MPEKFPNQEALAAQAEAEEAAFWKKEIDEWVAKRQDDGYKNSPEDKIYNDLVNNIHGWVNVPEGLGSFYGAKRTAASLEYYKENPEKLEEIKRLMKDVDAYIEANNLGDYALGLAEQQVEQARAYNEMFRTRNPKAIEGLKTYVTDGERLEFKKDLYYAMRRKGYSGVLLRT